MADFIAAFKTVIGNEGGYVNNSSDRGGPTNFGITMKTLQDYRKKSVTIDDVKCLKIEEAQAIYKKFFWNKKCIWNFS